ncbi:MAG: glycosyltransferase [Pseudomonadota bacterium]|nr:glycosyltransferase [Pseudomonadota bacterium]
MRPYLFARELVALGQDIRIVAPNVCPGIPTIVVPHHHVDPSLTETGSKKSWRTFARLWMLPDPDIRWALNAARSVVDYTPDWIITTSPPESSHVAGWLLKRRFRCRWLVDFRDHWFEATLRLDRSERGLWTRIEKFLAKKLLRRADSIVATTQSIAHEVGELLEAGRETVIEHAADPVTEAINLEPGLVHIVHTGSFKLSDPQRELRPILEGFIASNDNRLRLHLVGRLQSEEISLVASLPGSNRIQVHGPVDYETARAFQAAADILLLVTAPDTPHIPGKLAEYRTTGKPVLAIGGGAWQKAAGIPAFSDPKFAFENLQNLSPATVRLTPDSAAEQLLTLLNSVA